MFWQDVLLGWEEGDSALAGAAAAALGVPDQAVRIVDAVTDGGPNKPPVRLLIERSLLKGDYPFHLSVYVNDSEVEKGLHQPGATTDRVIRLCQLLGCFALISDDALSPLSWLRISPAGAIERVTLDAERLDRDEYVIAVESPSGARQVPLAP